MGICWRPRFRRVEHLDFDGALQIYEPQRGDGYSSERRFSVRAVGCCVGLPLAVDVRAVGRSGSNCRWDDGAVDGWTSTLRVTLRVLFGTLRLVLGLRLRRLCGSGCLFNRPDPPRRDRSIDHTKCVSRRIFDRVHGPGPRRRGGRQMRCQGGWRGRCLGHSRLIRAVPGLCA